MHFSFVKKLEKMSFRSNFFAFSFDYSTKTLFICKRIKKKIKILNARQTRIVINLLNY